MKPLYKICLYSHSNFPNHQMLSPVSLAEDEKAYSLNISPHIS